MVIIKSVINHLNKQLARQRNLRLSWVLVMLVGLIVLVSYIISGFVFTTSPALQKALISPFSRENHLMLARMYLDAGNIQQATNEIELTKQLVKTDDLDVLGTFNQISLIENDIQLITQTPNQELVFWQNLLMKYPDYKIGLINLALLAYNEDNLPKARSYGITLVSRFPDVRFDLPEEIISLISD